MATALSAPPARRRLTDEEHLESARAAIRDVERFGYRLVHDIATEDEQHEAHVILAMAIGLRRKLENWRRPNG